MGTPGVWADYELFVNNFIPKQTVPKLRQIADQILIHANINLGLRSQERKSDIVDKIKHAFLTLRKNNQEHVYLAVRRQCEQIATNYRQHVPMPQPTFGGVPATANYHAQQAAARYNPAGAIPPPRPLTGWQQVSASGSNVYAGRQQQLADWKSSPMWKPVRALTNMEGLPDIHSSDSSHTRRERKAHFSLPGDVIEQLNATKANPRARPIYSVRLFCASSDYYRPPGMAGPPGVPPPSNRAVPIEFPNNPDVMVDDHAIPFKERGLRGKPGSAPPLDLDKGARGLVRIPGRMASVTMGHTGPTVGKKKEQAKKFWFQVVYCEMKTIDDLLKTLEALVPTDAALEQQRLRQRGEDDDDIEIGPSSLSLKDPLSGMRITKPIRSSRCSHLQCFDARWWLESNRSHPQWLCPHCNKTLDFDDIICDGYFLSILRACPDTVDEVTLESNGEWHTATNTHGSAAWLQEHRTASASVHATPAPQSISFKRERSASPGDDPHKKRAIEILSDSSDDEAQKRAPNGVSHPPHTNGIRSAQPTRSSASVQPSEPAVIDLTLSSDEEDDAPAAPYFRQPGAGSTRLADAASGPRPASSTSTAVGAANPHSSVNGEAPPSRGFGSASGLYRQQQSSPGGQSSSRSTWVNQF